MVAWYGVLYVRAHRAEFKSFPHRRETGGATAVGRRGSLVCVVDSGVTRPPGPRRTHNRTPPTPSAPSRHCLHSVGYARRAARVDPSRTVRINFTGHSSLLEYRREAQDGRRLGPGPTHLRWVGLQCLSLTVLRSRCSISSVRGSFGPAGVRHKGDQHPGHRLDVDGSTGSYIW